jgi:cytochrome c biogenesis factor
MWKSIVALTAFAAAIEGTVLPRDKLVTSVSHYSFY